MLRIWEGGGTQTAHSHRSSCPAEHEEITSKLNPFIFHPD